MITRDSKKRKNNPSIFDTTDTVIEPLTTTVDKDEEDEPSSPSDTDESEYEDDESEYEDDESEYEVENSDYEYLESDDKQILENLKKTNPEAYEDFLKAKHIIKSREITIMEILTVDISDEKRANLIEQYECLHQIQPCTMEYLDSRDTLRTNYYKYIEAGLPQSSTVKPPPPNHKVSCCGDESTVFNKKIKDLMCSSQNRKVLEEKLEEFDDNHRGEEKTKIKKWLSLSLALPYDRLTLNNYDVKDKIQEISDFLNKKLYGMKNVKERLMLFLNKKLRQEDGKGCSIALLGIPGVGKSSIAKALSECLGLPFAQLSFGGVNSPDFLLGHDYTYVGSRPGEISRCMSRMGSKNGILFFDEFDKISDKRDILSSLLHITDFSQNNEFRDSYFPELTQDLSKCWFIYSMNNLPDDPALVDRLEVITVDGYSIEDRKIMVREYIIPKYIADLKISEEIVFTDEAVDKIVLLSGDGKRGVRDLERYISLIIEKTYFFMCNKVGKYEFKWYKKMVTNGPVITGEIVDLILNDKKIEHVYQSMYM
jgi:hypothetical protein